MDPAAEALSVALADFRGASPVFPAILTASLPNAVYQAGELAAAQSVAFFTARLPNATTRAAYGRAVSDFCRWCDARSIPLRELSAPLVAAYYHELLERLSPASANQHLSALRQWLDWLTRSGALPFNPAAAVRAARLARKEGKTPILDREQARLLFASLASPAVLVRRDRAILAVMLYGFARAGAVVRMRVSDFQELASGACLLLREKGGKERRIPAHHRVCEDVRAYLDATGLDAREHGRAPLFQSSRGRSGVLSGKALDRRSVLGIVKRRCRDVGLPPAICSHSFRATGITLHHENGGDIETAALWAGHADMRSTQLYNRHRRQLSRVEVERVQI